MAKKKRNRGGLVVLLVLLIASGIGAYYLYPKLKAYLTPKTMLVELKKGENQPLLVPMGSTEKDVADLLLEEGVISNRDAFLKTADNLRYNGSRVRAGHFKIEGGWSNDELFLHLKAGEEVWLSTDGVHTLKQLAGQMSKNIALDSATVLNYVTSPEVLNKYGFDQQTIISIFYADRYRVFWDITPEQLVEKMAGLFKAFWTPELKTKAKEMGLSQSEVTTLASIVYGECGNVLNQEWSTVAGLYVNRINRGIKLQSDPTVKYANGKFNQQRVYYKDLKVDHPYNTYIIDGLPPGPIMPIKTEVLEAVLNYEKHNYIFMCAKPGGYTKGHNFGATEGEHSRNKAKYHRWLNENDIR